MPVPGRPYPKAWIYTSNDDMGLPDPGVSDDHRTASINAGYRHGRWIGLIDGAILTAKDIGYRTDELTLSLGYVVVPSREAGLLDGDRLQVLAGGGIRITDDLNGENIQTQWHKVFSWDTPAAIYEDGHEELLAWVSADWDWKQPLFGENWKWGLAGNLRALGTTEATAKVAPVAHAVISHPKFDAWLGVRYEWRGGTTTTKTKAEVYDAEEGTWLSYGIAPGRSVLVQMGYNMETNESFGTLGYVWPARQH